MNRDQAEIAKVAATWRRTTPGLLAVVGADGYITFDDGDDAVVKANKG